MANVKEIEWKGGIYNIADETARGEAQQARALANTAQASANTAQTTANTAQTTANTAQTSAENAQTTANTAQTTANTAQTTADNAQTIANRLKNLVSGTPNPIVKGAFFDVKASEYHNGMGLESFMEASLDDGYDFLTYYATASVGFVMDKPLYISEAVTKFGIPYTSETFPSSDFAKIRFFFLEVKRF